MTAEKSARSKFYFYNTMVCLLKALEGKEVVVEMRKDIVLRGKLGIVESRMNLNMTDVKLTDVKGRTTNYSKFYIQGRHIRFVWIPDEVDIIKAMEWQLNKTEYFQDKERQNREKIFQKRQKMRAKQSAKLEKREQRDA